MGTGVATPPGMRRATWQQDDAALPKCRTKGVA
jgi:hypothetical protein